MASITLTLTDICSGGGHLTFTLSGVTSGTARGEIDDLTGPLTEEDKRGFVRSLVKLGKVGRTNAQLKTLFQNGVTVSL